MVEAKINKEYLIRMCAVALFMVAVCLWSLYDGFVGYPGKNSEFARARPALQSTNLTVRAWLTKTGEKGETPLDLVFAERGLKTPSKLIRKMDEHKMADNLPREMIRQGREYEKEALRRIFSKALYSVGDLRAQMVLAVIAALAAGWITLLVLPRVPKVFVADETGLRGSGFGDKPLKYADIESIDWKLWDKKGIVRIKVKGGLLFTLDGWHYNGVREVVEAIVAERPDLK